jgi:hypothetical protein
LDPLTSPPPPTPVPSPPPTPGAPTLPKGGIWIVYQGSLIQNGQPNAVAQRIVSAKQTYGRPEWVEITTAYPYGEISTALVNYFHSAGVKCSFRVWSAGGSNPLAKIKSQIDQTLALAPNVDMVIIDECNGGMLAYCQDLATYIHGKGKLIAFNLAGYDFSTAFPAVADMITTEFWWYIFTQNHQDYITAYPQMWAAESNDWGYANVGPPSMPPVAASGDRPAYSSPMSEARAVWETKYAWQHGIHYFDVRPGEGFTLPDWWEEYLRQLQGY